MQQTLDVCSSLNIGNLTAPRDTNHDTYGVSRIARWASALCGPANPKQTLVTTQVNTLERVRFRGLNAQDFLRAASITWGLAPDDDRLKAGFGHGHRRLTHRQPALRLQLHSLSRAFRAWLRNNKDCDLDLLADAHRQPVAQLFLGHNLEDAIPNDNWRGYAGSVLVCHAVPEKYGIIRSANLQDTGRSVVGEQSVISAMNVGLFYFHVESSTPQPWDSVSSWITFITGSGMTLLAGPASRHRTRPMTVSNSTFPRTSAEASQSLIPTEKSRRRLQ